MADQPKQQDYIRTGSTLAAGAKGATSGALAGAQIGAMTANPAGLLAGALIGGTVGFVSSAIAADAAQSGSFQQAMSAYNVKKDKEKMARQAAKQQFQAQKSRMGKKDKTSDMPAVAAYDADIMQLTPGAGTSQYDQFLGNAYGYTT
jgi:outer membrane lipoprotein SlyB